MPIFVIHEHWSKHHHFDFRLQSDQVLRSWAVPKGVPEESNVKRLAIRVEDHPLEYADFSGEIAEGQYGAGKVVIWDKGEYDLIIDEPDHIKFKLHGSRVSGGYQLVRFRKDDDKGYWLLMKAES